MAALELRTTLGSTLCFTAVLVLLIFSTPAAIARKVHSQRSPGGAADHGFQSELILRGKEGLSTSEKLAAQIARGHARAYSLGAIVSSGGNYDSPLSSVPGGFAMTLNIGTPKQTFTAIADTGSDLIWVQSKICTSCFQQPDPLFDPSKSSTYQKLLCSNPFCAAIPEKTCNSTGVKTCPYVYQYGDSSQTEGDLASETITLASTNGGTTEVKNLIFGSGTNNTGTFQDVDGLVGLGKGSLSLTSQLGSQFSNKFSYCLVPFGSQFVTPSPIYFGEAAVPSGNVEYTPLVSNPVHSSFYYVNLKSLSVDGEKLKIPSTAFAIDAAGQGGLLFDSGTTITYLVTAAYNPLEQALKRKISYPQTQSPQPDILRLCYAPGTGSPSFPTVTFHFQGADFTLPSENSFIPVDPFGQTYCLAMSTSPFPLNIFGNVQQANNNILYDRANSRMGFLPTQCGSN